MADRQLPNWIDAYMEYTQHTEPADLYRRWVGVFAISSALRRRVWIRWHENIYPNVYVVLVGPSGCRKGTAIGPGFSLVRQLGVRIAPDSITRQALIQVMEEATESIEVNGILHEYSALTIISPELAVFLGQNNLDLLSDLTDWYDCREPWIYRTKGSGTNEIPRVWASMLGATTPSILKNSLPQDAIGGGLSSRIIFVFADKKGKRVIFPQFEQMDLSLEQKLMHDLHRIASMQGPFNVSDSFTEAYAPWYVEQDNKPPFSIHGPFHGYIERRATHLLKLCMIVNAARTSTQSITADDFHTALKLLEMTEKMMPHVFESYGRYEYSDLLPVLATFIRMNSPITENQIMREFIGEIGTRAVLQEIMETMQMAGLVFVQHTNAGAVYYDKGHPDVQRLLNPPNRDGEAKL